MTQKQRILNYMKRHGSITARDAFIHLGITKLATRVSEMSSDGIEFEKEWIKGKNRWGEPEKHMKYTLKG